MGLILEIPQILIQYQNTFTVNWLHSLSFRISWLISNPTRDCFLWQIACLCLSCSQSEHSDCSHYISCPKLSPFTCIEAISETLFLYMEYLFSKEGLIIWFPWNRITMFKMYSFLVYDCLPAYMCTMCEPGTCGSHKRASVIWNGSYWGLQAAIYILGIEHLFSERAVPTLDHLVISPAPNKLFCPRFITEENGRKRERERKEIYDSKYKTFRAPGIFGG